jgi:hypothetical protein
MRDGAEYTRGLAGMQRFYLPSAGWRTLRLQPIIKRRVLETGIAQSRKRTLRLASLHVMRRQAIRD